MRARTISAVALAAAAPAAAVLVGRSLARRRAPTKQPIVVTPETASWELLPGAPPELKIHVLRGDPQRGAYASLVRFGRGFEVPLHTHSHEMRFVVVSGTLVITPRDGTPIRCGPGTYFVQPADWPHTTYCDSADGCLIAQEQDGPFDICPLNGSPAGREERKG